MCCVLALTGYTAYMVNALMFMVTVIYMVDLHKKIKKYQTSLEALKKLTFTNVVKFRLWLRHFALDVGN